MAKKSRGRGPMEVLFIGNSVTARNDLPGWSPGSQRRGVKYSSPA